MLTQHNHNRAVASDILDFSTHAFPLDKKTRERLAAQRKMAARRAIERHFESRELELHSKEYWFDG